MSNGSAVLTVVLQVTPNLVPAVALVSCEMKISLLAVTAVVLTVYVVAAVGTAT